jgi:hypothetical protein
MAFAAVRFIAMASRNPEKDGAFHHLEKYIHWMALRQCARIIPWSISRVGLLS